MEAGIHQRAGWRYLRPRGREDWDTSRPFFCRQTIQKHQRPASRHKAGRQRSCLIRDSIHREFQLTHGYGVTVTVVVAPACVVPLAVVPVARAMLVTVLEHGFGFTKSGAPGFGGELCTPTTFTDPSPNAPKVELLTITV